MKKLIIRLLAVILSVYVAGSIYPLLAHEAGHGPAPAPAPAPPPPPAPSAPAMLDTKGPPLQPPPPVDSGGGGCGPEYTQPVRSAVIDRAEWRENDFDDMASRSIEQVKQNADYFLENIRRDIKQAQENWHQADVEVHKYQGMKNRATLVGQELLQTAQEERQEKWEELQRQKGRLEKVEAWRSQKTREIWALRDRAKNGDYNGYRGLRNFDTSVHPNQFK